MNDRSALTVGSQLLRLSILQSRRCRPPTTASGCSTSFPRDSREAEVRLRGHRPVSGPIAARLGEVRGRGLGLVRFAATGLLFTNHHVASECIQQLSTKENDYMNNGFYAATEADERKCPDLEADVLLSMRGRHGQGARKACPADAASAEAGRARRANIARIEKDCTTSPEDRCEVVTLYSGGEYHLYRYRKYTDIRLVFAPEVGIAAFGGDPDNFTYPRYCLDMTFFRAYENEQAGRDSRLPALEPGGREGRRADLRAGQPRLPPAVSTPWRNSSSSGTSPTRWSTPGWSP